jgi:hypothetical protein
MIFRVISARATSLRTRGLNDTLVQSRLLASKDCSDSAAEWKYVNALALRVFEAWSSISKRFWHNLRGMSTDWVEASGHGDGDGATSPTASGIWTSPRCLSAELCQWRPAYSGKIVLPFGRCRSRVPAGCMGMYSEVASCSCHQLLRRNLALSEATFPA